MEADGDEAGVVVGLQAVRADSVYARLAGIQRPTHRANPAISMHAPSAER